MNRISWNDYFMTMALWVARRSPDPHTQHGCVIVDNNHRVISMGFNGYPRGSDDINMPKERPEKYLVTIHAEENAILFANTSLDGMTAYITGEPCPNCWARMIQVGIKKFVIGNKSSTMIDSKSLHAISVLLSGRNLEIVKWKPNRDVVTQNMYKILDEIQKQEI